MKRLLGLFILLMMPMLAFAQVVDVAVVAEAPVEALFDVIAQWSTLSVLGRSLSIVVFGTYLVQRFVSHGAWKRLIVSILSVANGIMAMILNGTPWWKASILIIISGAGGVGIYEAYKGLRKVLGK